MKKHKVKVYFDAAGLKRTETAKMIGTNVTTISLYNTGKVPKGLNWILDFAIETETPLSDILLIEDKNGNKIDLKDIV